MSNSVRPHRRQRTRLPHPWDSPGNSTGVGCHFLLQCMKVKSELTQSCPTLSSPMDCSLPGSSVCSISDILRKTDLGDFPGGPVVIKTSPSNAGGAGSIPGWGAKIPCLVANSQNRSNKLNCNKFNKDLKKNGPH